MLVFVVAMLCLHVVTATFWAGSTFTLARGGGVGAPALFRPQMGAATVALLSGAVVWYFWHAGSYGWQEATLAVGAATAVAAAGVQGALRRRPAVAQRAAAPLLVVTLIAMVASRFAG